MLAGRRWPWRARPCAADNDGLTLPAGFTATVVQEGLGAGRHLAIAANGDIYLASHNGLVAMRDKDGDGKVDETAPFGDVQGTEVRIFKNWLYVSDDVGVYRYPLKKGELAPTGAQADRGRRVSRRNASTPTRPSRSIRRARCT